MKKMILILIVLMFWASPAVAQQAAGSKAAETTESTGSRRAALRANLDLGYRSDDGEWQSPSPGNMSISSPAPSERWTWSGTRFRTVLCSSPPF